MSRPQLTTLGEPATWLPIFRYHPTIPTREVRPIPKELQLESNAGREENIELVTATQQPELINPQYHGRGNGAGLLSLGATGRIEGSRRAQTGKPSPTCPWARSCPTIAFPVACSRREGVLKHFQGDAGKVGFDSGGVSRYE